MIWITRSEPGAGVLAEALQASGFDVWCQPLIEIEPLRPFQAWVARGQWAIESAAAPDLIIALSGHAVREYLASALVRLAGDAPHIAVGAGTAALLTDAGFEVTQPGEATSEGILAMPQLAVLTAQHEVWILAGAGGRELVLQQLTEQVGCEVVKFELYRRRRATLQELPVAAIGVVSIASEGALRAFAEIWREAGGPVDVAILVPSERVAFSARAMGFENVHNARGAGVEDVLAALQELDQV